MKHRFAFFAAALLLLSLCAPGAPAEDASALRVAWVRLTGPADSLIAYPTLEAESDAGRPITEKINAAIVKKARIDEYTRLMDTIREGSTGLRLEATYALSADAASGKGFISLVVSASGKMLSGRPSQVYYPMTFDLATGEELGFDALFSDPDAAKAFIEAYLEDQVAPTLSTYLENSALFPVPYDCFALSGRGHITFYYPHDQLSFLSGSAGAVSLRYSELWEHGLDTSPDGVPLRFVETETGVQPLLSSARSAVQQAGGDIAARCCAGLFPGLEGIAPVLGTLLSDLDGANAITLDSEYFPGGASVETENPLLRGTLLLTDENEALLTGLLSSRVDAPGVITGKTALTEAKAALGEPVAEIAIDEETAESCRVCPGVAAVYRFEQETAEAAYTLYADRDGVVQFIQLERHSRQ